MITKYILSLDHQSASNILNYSFRQGLSVWCLLLNSFLDHFHLSTGHWHFPQDPSSRRGRLEWWQPLFSVVHSFGLGHGRGCEHPSRSAGGCDPVSSTVYPEALPSADWCSISSCAWYQHLQVTAHSNAIQLSVLTSPSRHTRSVCWILAKGRGDGCSIRRCLQTYFRIFFFVFKVFIKV